MIRLILRKWLADSGECLTVIWRFVDMYRLSGFHELQPELACRCDRGSIIAIDQDDINKF